LFKVAQAEGPPIDPLVRALTQRKIANDVATYVRLLDTEASESAVHEFLSAHSYFFSGVLRLDGISPLYAKVKLGAEYEVDFACFDSGSYGPEWCLVEIEAPSKRMFTRKGDPTAALTHAIRQVRDWHAWIHENLAYAGRLMPNIEYPLGYVFIGRRNHLTVDTRKKLRRLVHDHRMLLRVHTLDWFASAALAVKQQAAGRARCSWPVPLRALSHSDLAAGRPEWVWEWLCDAHVATEKRHWQRNLLNEREYSYVREDEYRNSERE
jgi:hypothetical protein